MYILIYYMYYLLIPCTIYFTAATVLFYTLVVLIMLIRFIQAACFSNILAQLNIFILHTINCLFICINMKINYYLNTHYYAPLSPPPYPPPQHPSHSPPHLSTPPPHLPFVHRPLTLEPRFLLPSQHIPCHVDVLHTTFIQPIRDHSYLVIVLISYCSFCFNVTHPNSIYNCLQNVLYNYKNYTS